MSNADLHPGEAPPAATPDAPHGDRRRAVVGAILLVLIIVAAGFAIYGQRHAFVDGLRKIGIGAMVGSYVLAASGVVCTYFMWRQVLIGLDVDMPLAFGARAFFVSQLGKYLPGSVWPVLIQMEAGRARGASRRTMLAGNLIVIILSCAVGLILACILLPASDAHALSKYWWLLIALPFLLALVHPRALPSALDLAFSLARREPLRQRLPLDRSARAAAWAVVSFTLQGLHVAVLALAIGGTGFSTVLLCIGGMSLAVSAGVLFLPAPAGAGIRDVVLILVLRSVLGSGQALAVVVASRALLIAADVMLAGLATAANRSKRVGT